jgi:hypothetical protein
VVARPAPALDNARAPFRAQSRQQDTRLDLRACDLRRVSTARSGLCPSTMSGACPPTAATRAPIISSGSMMRRIGRPLSESSPASVEAKGCAASRPATSLIVVPEFPQSSVRAGARNCGAPSSAAPAPSMLTVVADDPPPRSTRTPSPSSTESVDAQSALVAKFRISVRPRASDATMAARCEIDLSPGTRTRPQSLFAGLIIIARF